MRGASSPGEHVSLEVDAGFDAFYRTEYVRTVRLARLLTGRDDLAEDLAHEAFIRLHRAHPALDGLDNPAAYLHTITVNVCRNHRRTESRDASRLRRVGAPSDELPTGYDELSVLVATLPYRQRAVLVLRYWLDLTEAEIARRLDCRPGTVKSLHSRALTRIRTELTS